MPVHTPIQRSSLRAGAQICLLALFGAAALVTTPSQATLSIGNNPLYLTAGKANVLIILDNSNSMDEAPSGAAAGSNNATSKSEIARSVVRNLTDTYQSRINMGLMAYKQNTPDANYLHNSPYDASYNPANYDASWTGARSSPTHKRFRMANPVDPGNYVHYNVALPFYSSSDQGTAFCYAKDADASHDFNNGENPATGPWDNYRCFSSKTGTSDTPPTWRNTTSEAAAGYSGFFFEQPLSPTDSDFAQGILDFGKQLMWTSVGRTWFSNSSPGRGYLYTPIKDLDSTQAASIKAKLACNIPGTPSPCTSSGIKNAGLTPIEGTLLTARDYFGGSWSNSGEGYTSDCYPLPTSCGKDFVILLTDGLPSTDKNGNTLSNPTTALSNAATAAATLKAAGITTYVIGFALPYGTAPGSLDTIAASGGSTTAYNASDSASLDAAFKSIFDDIFRRTSSFNSAAQNSTSLNDGTRVYQGRFDSTDWSGEVRAMRISGTSLTDDWSSSTAGKIPDASTRKVFTMKSDTNTGVAFKVLGDLATAQQAYFTAPDCSASLTGTACGQARIDWARGDQSRETTSGGPFRKRSKILGDVISSSPFYSPESKTVFVGANDGMLHAFDAATGTEQFAYVPKAVLPNLYKLSQTSYAHQYFVDGEITVTTTAQTPGKNILIGSLGRGGKALYALDVTTPSTFSASKVLWEFTDSDLGLVLGKPFVAKLNNGTTAVVVGNGYNSGSEHAVLFLINAETGALIKKIDTGVGSAAASNGLASPKGWDKDGDGTLDYVYAGDLQGNLWKFDLTGGSGSWDVAYHSGGANAPLFVAKDATLAANRQPITGGVALAIDARAADANFGKLHVFFGTGRYLVTADKGDTSIQSWYGVVDAGAPVSGRSELVTRTVDTVSTVSSGDTGRVFSLAVTNDMVGKKGWVLDFKTSAGVAEGERIITDTKLVGTTLLSSSIVPSTDTCAPGGVGWLNAIDAFTGGDLVGDAGYFDVDGDGLIGSADKLGGKNLSSLKESGTNKGMPGESIMICNKDKCDVVDCKTDGNCKVSNAKKAIRFGRISWREVVR